ncbi:MAG: RRXRR domain-containing protein, partial [Waterburya sp.]
MNRVPVVDKNNQPLMPTKPSKARKLVQDGKAIGKFNQLGLYYIQLTFNPSDTKTQLISAGIDPGKHYSGIGLQSAKFTLFTAHLFLPFQKVKDRMEQRKMMRRNRRGRRINRKIPFQVRSHRQKRFSNRRNSKLAPSIKANRLLEIKVISELAKIYPLETIVYEIVKADVDLTSGRRIAKSGKGFSPVMVGQNWAVEQLSKIAPVVKKHGFETSNLRKHLGLKKQKHSKSEAIAATHAVDAVALACYQFVDYKPFENSQGHGHCWQGKIQLTTAPFLVVRRPPISRRQLHLMVFAKGGIRRKYGGTTTRHGVRKGDFLEAQKAGIVDRGWCSGDTERAVSVSD